MEDMFQVEVKGAVVENIGAQDEIIVLGMVPAPPVGQKMLEIGGLPFWRTFKAVKARISGR